MRVWISAAIFATTGHLLLLWSHYLSSTCRDGFARVVSSAVLRGDPLWGGATWFLRAKQTRCCLTLCVCVCLQLVHCTHSQLLFFNLWGGMPVIHRWDKRKSDNIRDCSVFPLACMSLREGPSSPRLEHNPLMEYVLKCSTVIARTSRVHALSGHKICWICLMCACFF